VIVLQKLAEPANVGASTEAPSLSTGLSRMKQFSSFSEQIDNLEANKGLIIGDRTAAEESLHRIGYFGLIGGYKDVFKYVSHGRYRYGTRFEDIVALYEFDENLRELFLRYILRVERCIRSLLSYYFTERHGADQAAYLDCSNYSKLPKHRGMVSQLVKILDALTNKNTDYAYLNHQRKKYDNVPLWALMNAVTFGTLSKFFLLTTPNIKAKVAQNFPGVNERQLEQFLNALTKYRNVSAHNERLFSFKIKSYIPDMPLHAKLGLPKKGTQYLNGKHDLFAAVIALRYLLPDGDFKDFKRSLQLAITGYLKSTTAVTEAKLCATTGFPPNWRNITRYKK
jgi:abortive infection bacteriophage resistance protein